MVPGSDLPRFQRTPPDRFRNRNSCGWCYRSGFHDLHCQAKLVAVDEQADNNIVQLDRFGKADRLAHQPLETRAQGEMFTLDLLRVVFARAVDCGSEMPLVGTPI